MFDAGISVIESVSMLLQKLGAFPICMTAQRDTGGIGYK